MPDYYVVCDVPLRRARIHRSSCGACNDGKGMHRAVITAGRNWEPAETYAEARAIVGNLEIKGLIKKGDRTNCGLCQPELPQSN